MKTELTAARLRELLHYDQATGVFTRRVNAGIKAQKRMLAGTVAGGRHKEGYISIGIDGRDYLAHRLAWLYVHGAWPQSEIDHRDGVRSNNAFTNLREANKSQNQQNLRGAKRSSKSGILGVRIHKASGLWHARITVCGKEHSLGYFRDPELARQAYLSAKLRLHPYQTIVACS